MEKGAFLHLCVLASLNFVHQGGSYVYEEELLYDTFPDGFNWGAATSAYQIEGGWNEGGKGLSIWDTFTEDDSNVIDGSDGKVACDSYHNYPEDVQLIRDMGLTHYRFSISWTRILPEGTGTVNQEGVAYYNSLIDELLANGITPLVTIYHWDLPQALEDQGGWKSESSPTWFEEYAVACFGLFGDRVKDWITLNEPIATALLGYGTGQHAPGLTEMTEDPYKVGHNLIKAHARAYNAYQASFASDQRGRVGITVSVKWFEPTDPEDPSHEEAGETMLQFWIGWFAKPILVDGHYPDVMREKVDGKSEAQGYEESRLPTFTEEEAAEIAGTADFLGVNPYTSNLVVPRESDVEHVSILNDPDVFFYLDETWYPSGSSWLRVTPFGMRSVLNWLRDEYGDEVELVVTENGFSDQQGNLDDPQRIYYYKHYINQVLKAVKLDGVNVTGYFAWSLLDNFEWSNGYTEKFGLHYVDFSDSTRPRTAKESARYLASLAAANGFAVESDGDPCTNG